MIELKLNVGGVVINDTVLEVQHEGFIYHYKVTNTEQLEESINHFLQELSEWDVDFKVDFCARDELVVYFYCTFCRDCDEEIEVTVSTDFNKRADKYYMDVFGKILSGLGYKVKFL